MLGFKHSNILEGIDYVGVQLREARQGKKLSLELAAKKSGINYDYLKLLEQGNIDSLPEGVYSKNYLREYAYFLGIKPKPLLEILDKEILKKQKQSTDVFSRKVPGKQLFLSVPKIVKNILSVIVILIFISYLGYYLIGIISPPEIAIFYPEKDIVISDKNITINGKTETEAKLTINNELVLLDPNGNFEKKINLSLGVNIINITAEKKYGKKTTIIRNIIVEE